MCSSVSLTDHVDFFPWHFHFSLTLLSRLTLWDAPSCLWPLVSWLCCEWMQLWQEVLLKHCYVFTAISRILSPIISSPRRCLLKSCYWVESCVLQVRAEAVEDVYTSRKKQHQTMMHYFCSLNTLQYKKKTALLEPLLGYMQAQVHKAALHSRPKWKLFMFTVRLCLLCADQFLQAGLRKSHAAVGGLPGNHRHQCPKVRALHAHTSSLKKLHVFLFVLNAVNAWAASSKYELSVCLCVQCPSGDGGGGGADAADHSADGEVMWLAVCAVWPWPRPLTCLS